MKEGDHICLFSPLAGSNKTAASANETLVYNRFKRHINAHP